MSDATDDLDFEPYQSYSSHRNRGGTPFAGETQGVTPKHLQNLGNLPQAKSIEADLKALEVPKMVVWVDGEMKVETTNLTEKTITEIMSLFKVYSQTQYDLGYEEGGNSTNADWLATLEEEFDIEADSFAQAIAKLKQLNRGAETGVENG